MEVKSSKNIIPNDSEPPMTNILVVPIKNFIIDRIFFK
jgi:hypothetical protein